MQLAPVPQDMPDTPAIVPVTLARHGGQRWHRFRDYGFARHRTELPLALAETDALAGTFPILFRKIDNAPVPVVMLAPAGQETVPVVGRDGRWCAPYVPAALRAYPFDMSETADDGAVLTIDEGSGLMSGQAQGLPFFDKAGQMAPDLRQVRSFLRLRMAGQRVARRAAAALAEADLLCPLPELDIGGPGLWAVDDAALMNINSIALADLWQSGALRLAMAHRISLHHMKWLVRAQAPTPEPPSEVGGFLAALARARTGALT